MIKIKKKILVLTPRLPYPVIGGDRLRIYQVCKALSSEFSLTLLSLCEKESELEIEIPNDGIFESVERILLKRRYSYLNTLRALFRYTPLQVEYYRSSEFANSVNRLIPNHDGVLSHLIRCAEYVKNVDKPKILEMTDAISLNYSRVSNLNKGFWIKGLIYSFESKRLLAYEREIIKRFDLSVLVSEKDKEFLNQIDQQNVLVCSNGVNFETFKFNSRKGSKSVIVYIGNMYSVQNMDACLFFSSSVMPLLQKEIDVTFRVVGRIKNSDAKKLMKFANVEVTGEVEDISLAVSDAKIGVCPVRLAAGVQNKVLEYMALGLPVVTSSIGLEGFQAIPNKDLLIANTPEEFLISILKIWDNEELRNQLSIDGRKYVESYHKWEVQLAPLVKRVKDIVC